MDGERPPACVVDDTAWLDWTAENTPARFQADAASLDGAREVCRRLSHATWAVELDEVWGRWRIQSGDGRTYLQKCSAAALDRHVLSLRPPDPANLLDPERANTIAVEYDGSWGAARIVLVAPGAWVLWVKGSDGQWPTDEDLDEVIEHQGHRPGAVTFHIRRGSRSFLIPPVDETAWRWLLANEREEGMKPREPSAAERLGKALGVSAVRVGGSSIGGGEDRPEGSRTAPPDAPQELDRGDHG
jgi:hypothetical protein